MFEQFIKVFEPNLFFYKRYFTKLSKIGKLLLNTKSGREVLRKRGYFRDVARERKVNRTTKGVVTWFSSPSLKQDIETFNTI